MPRAECSGHTRQNTWRSQHSIPVLPNRLLDSAHSVPLWFPAAQQRASGSAGICTVDRTLSDQNLRRHCSLHLVTASASAAETASPGLFSSLMDKSLGLSFFCNTLDLSEREPLPATTGGLTKHGEKSPSDSRRGHGAGADRQALGRRLSPREKQAGGSLGGRRVLPLLPGPESRLSLPRRVLALGLCVGWGGHRPALRKD